MKRKEFLAVESNNTESISHIVAQDKITLKEEILKNKRQIIIVKKDILELQLSSKAMNFEALVNLDKKLTDLKFTCELLKEYKKGLF